ncbi:MAG: hypothetical protein JOZ69_14645, partial [Myxococcales bacterium]|nr:hypothetical protein [Myxococcales bacterium]
MVNRGEFREDVYFRLAVVPVRVPALRERTEDIGLLLTRFSEGSTGWLTPRLVRALESMPWRGNVRELRNFAARARALGPAEALARCAEWAERRETRTTPPTGIREIRRSGVAPAPERPAAAEADAGTRAGASGIGARADAGSDGGAGHAEGDVAPRLSQPFRSFRGSWIAYGERAFLVALLERHDRNVAEAAREAGLERTYLYRLLRKHGI